jgi:YHS domain-containing protein
MLLASAVTAAEKGDKKTAEPKELPCAVMKSHKVNLKDATAKKAFADYKGNRYFFCCAGCAPEFKKDPEKYAKNPSVPTPKSETK